MPQRAKLLQALCGHTQLGHLLDKRGFAPFTEPHSSHAATYCGPVSACLGLGALYARQRLLRLAILDIVYLLDIVELPLVRGGGGGYPSIPLACCLLGFFLVDESFVPCAFGLGNGS